MKQNIFQKQVDNDQNSTSGASATETPVKSSIDPGTAQSDSGGPSDIINLVNINQVYTDQGKSNVVFRDFNLDIKESIALLRISTQPSFTLTNGDVFSGFNRTCTIYPNDTVFVGGGFHVKSGSTQPSANAGNVTYNVYGCFWNRYVAGYVCYCNCRKLYRHKFPQTYYQAGSCFYYAFCFAFCFAFYFKRT